MLPPSLCPAPVWWPVVWCVSCAVAALAAHIAVLHREKPVLFLALGAPLGDSLELLDAGPPCMHAPPCPLAS